MRYYHIMNWFPFASIFTIMFWLIFLAIAYLVYKDAEKRGMNGLLWALPILVPWIGILFLILYLVLREEKHLVAGKSNPEDILSGRYAKGELTREQYMQMKDDMRKYVE